MSLFNIYVYIVHSVLSNKDQHWEPPYTVQQITGIPYLQKSEVYTVELELLTEARGR